MIQNDWLRVERQSVLEGIRDCVIQTFKPVEYLKIQAWAHRNGLFATILQTAKSFEGFASRYEPGEELLVTAVTRLAEMGDKPEEHLGYPKCCQEAFESRWPLVPDPIWQWAGGPENGKVVSGGHLVTTRMLPTTNPLLRYLSVRFCPHIPCEALCQETVEFSTKLRSLMGKEFQDPAEELLSMPVSWDCYRGIAIVKIAPLRIVIGSTVTAVRYIVEATL